MWKILEENPELIAVVIMLIMLLVGWVDAKVLQVESPSIQEIREVQEITNAN